MCKRGWRSCASTSTWLNIKSDTLDMGVCLKWQPPPWPNLKVMSTYWAFCPCLYATGIWLLLAKVNLLLKSVHFNSLAALPASTHAEQIEHNSFWKWWNAATYIHLSHSILTITKNFLRLSMYVSYSQCMYVSLFHCIHVRYAHAIYSFVIGLIGHSASSGQVLGRPTDQWTGRGTRRKGDTHWANTRNWPRTC